MQTILIKYLEKDKPLKQAKIDIQIVMKNWKLTI